MCYNLLSSKFLRVQYNKKELSKETITLNKQYERIGVGYRYTLRHKKPFLRTLDEY